MPRDGYRRGRGGKQWKGDPPAKMPENKCPRCGNRVNINIDHKMKKVEAHCSCFGVMFLPYKGPAFESVDYADKLVDRLNSSTSAKGNISSKTGVKRIMTPSDWTRRVVSDFLILNPTAKDAQVAAKNLVSPNEVRAIRESIEPKDWKTGPAVITKPLETHTTGNEVAGALVKCPYCISKVRKDRLHRHIQKIHSKEA
jgi:transcription elongation factor Elf1